MPATITINGNLSDFGVDPLTTHPVLYFTPSGPAFSGNSLLDPTPKKVTPAANGDFSIGLVITEGLAPDAWYELVVDTLGDMGRRKFPGQLRIPIGGGTFQQIMATSFASSYVVKSEERPTAAFLYWYQPSTGNLYPWIGA